MRLVCRSCGARADGPPGEPCPQGCGALVSEAALMRTPDDPLLGRVLAGKFAVVDRIAMGGCGAVYGAIQHPVARRVAVKIIRPDRADIDELTRRFFREARAISLIRDPGAVALYDYGVEPADGLLFMALEYVEGETLRRVIDREAPMHPRRVVRLAAQILRTLATAHALDLVHRDLKPENLMLVRDAFGEEQTRLLDFGIAKHIRAFDAGSTPTFETMTGSFFGTPEYASPEQAIGKTEEIGPAADLYSLGVVLYHMLSARVPFQGHWLEVLSAQIERPPPPFSPDLRVPEALQRVVLRALAKAPAARYPDAQSMARALLESVGEGAKAPVPPPAPAAPAEASPPEQSGRTRRRRTRGLEVVATFAVVAVLSAFALHRPGPEAPIGALAVAPESLPAVDASAPASALDAALPPPEDAAVAIAPKPPPVRTPKRAAPRLPDDRAAAHARLMAEAKRRVLKGDREGAIERAEAALALVGEDLTAYRMLCANYARLRRPDPGVRRCREYRARVKGHAERAWADEQIDRLRR